MRKSMKRILSLVVAATMMFSLLTLPSYAIIAGEDAYITSTTIARYYANTQTTEYFVVSNDDDMFPGTSTYDFLSLEELENCSVDGEASTHSIIGKDDRLTISTDAAWQSIVLMLHGFDSDGDYLADKYIQCSGFLVADNVMVTAMHNMEPYMIEDYQYENYDYDYVSTIVYHGVSSTQVSSQISTLVAGSTPAHITSVSYDPRYFTALDSNGNTSIYDWCVITLDTDIDSNYLDCDIAISSIEGEVVGVAGYPGYPVSEDETNYQFVRKIGMGYVIANDGIILTHDADTTGGQSGGPLMTNVITGERVGYGIHIRGDFYIENGVEIGIENYARAITPEIYNTIVTIMEDS